MAAFRAISRLGPSRLTLADVAAEAGLSAAALVQRFGSKRELLLAAAADAATGSDYIFPGLRTRHRSPLQALLGLGDCMAELLGPTPEALVNTLAFQQLELSDQDFRRHAQVAARGMQLGIRALVKDALERRELLGCDADRLASALLATLNGALAGWAVERKGRLGAAIRRDLETVLAPYRAARKSASRPAAPGASSRRR
jgi:AcrR family transcriptional regulator